MLEEQRRDRMDFKSSKIVQSSWKSKGMCVVLDLRGREKEKRKVEKRKGKRSGLLEEAESKDGCTKQSRGSD